MLGCLHCLTSCDALKHGLLEVDRNRPTIAVVDVGPVAVDVLLDHVLVRPIDQLVQLVDGHLDCSVVGLVVGIVANVLVAVLDAEMTGDIVVAITAASATNLARVHFRNVFKFDHVRLLAMV